MNQNWRTHLLSRASGRSTALVLLLAACAAPDRPSLLPSPFPGGAAAFLAVDSVRGVRVADGATYFAVTSPEGPWQLHLVASEGLRCDLEMVVTPAPEGGDAGRERTAVSALVPRVDGIPYAGVNGDFFTDAGLPIGPETSETTHRPGARPALAWSPEGGPWIGVAGGEGRGGEYGAESRPGNDVDVIGGFPLLIRGGEVVGDLEVAARPSFAAARHPRTAAGIDRDTGMLWLVVVDGRSGESVGMSLPELAALFHELGVEDAVNLDGGGSSTMWVRGKVVNSPSDPAGERPVANGLWLVDRPGRCGH